MARQSLKACQVGIEKARASLTGKGWTQEELAEKVETTRQPVFNFFAGNGVDRKNFVKICEQLELDWQEITGQSKSTNLVTSLDSVVDVLVDEVRTHCKAKIEEECGSLRMLDRKTQPLNRVYVEVKIRSKHGKPIISNQQRIKNLKKSTHFTGASENPERPRMFSEDTKKFERIDLSNPNERIAGLDAVKMFNKVIILGKPGAGKTTFLKYLAIHCIESELTPNQTKLIPIYIRLNLLVKSKNTLQEYIENVFFNNKFSKIQVEKILDSGSVLFLLDGLDEVAGVNNNIKFELEVFANTFYKNQFIITSRLAAFEDSYEGFTEIEIADFTQEQMEAYVRKWFVENSKNLPEKDENKARQFIAKLKLSKYAQIQELATIPLLLNLLCLVFQENTDKKDDFDFPSNRYELCKEATEILLSKWDEEKGIKREQFAHQNINRDIEVEQLYRCLNVEEKVSFLSYIAAENWKKSIKQFPEEEILENIKSYFLNLEFSSCKPQKLSNEHCRVLLRAIESQHGLIIEEFRQIYSFYHLTFQEYFTAKYFLENPKQDALKDLISFMLYPDWREVFLIAVGNRKRGIDLLDIMNLVCQYYVQSNSDLKIFLNWCSEKANAVNANYEPLVIRAFYFELAIGFVLCQTISFNTVGSIAATFSGDSSILSSLELGVSLTWDINNTLDITCDPTFDSILALAHKLYEARKDTLALGLSPELQQLLQDLIDELFSIEQLENPKNKQQCWENNNWHWIEQLKTILIEHRGITITGITINSQFESRNDIDHYYDCTRLLVYCLTNGCELTPNIEKIKNTLLQIN
ncbi:NACHT domain-containing protein [Nostoc sp. TCL26-01]|uniref:NACHT domain-containing protein n=1 Tax=Nostoc sp. TCL26-01 TaxID=2576904 RepID=UPI0015B93692|nr:NACHT domain-containing protein [Nostoc sp. TCL26-01]QLE59994.1 NACHT domain-containing protein [Nostoc sp. TCL26-01]